MLQPFVEQRKGKFTEVLSLFMVRVATIGAFIVLVDIKFTLTFGEQAVTIGSGFSPDLKGAVITAILIGGWTAVKEFWLGSSAGQQTQSESISRIAEASAPTAAAAVKAASNGIIPSIAAVPEAVPQPPKGDSP